jgi:hypothetical protein
VESARQPVNGGDLRPVAAFSLLFLVPAVSVALSWLVVVELDLWDFAVPGALVVVTAPPLLAGAASRAVCSALRVVLSTAWSFALGSGAIAAVTSFAAFLAFFSAGAD